MPAVSKQQRRLFAIALHYKTGDIKDKDLPEDSLDKIIELSKLPEKTLRDYAETSEKNLPEKIKESTSIMGGGFPFGHEFASPVRQQERQFNYFKKDKIEAEIKEKIKKKKTIKKLDNVLTYEDWKNKSNALQEMDGGAASPMNTPGMGNVSPPSYGKMGSGDTFGSLAMNHSDWKKWNKMRKKTQTHKKKKAGVQTHRPVWEIGGDLPVPVANTSTS